ncbi:MAG: AI-2E family transporter, partial [Patescibacteria group bacterium]
MSSPLNSTYRVNITIGTIIKIAAIIFLLYIGYVIRDVLALLFVALIFSSAIDPWVDILKRYRIPRAISVIIIYVMAAIIVGLAIYLLIPPVTEQFNSLKDNFP